MFTKWDHRFMEMAQLVSTWASCYQEERKVGAVIVKDKRVMTTGRSDTGNRSPTHNTELQIFIGRKSLTVCKGHMQVTKCGLCNLLFYKL